MGTILSDKSMHIIRQPRTYTPTDKRFFRVGGTQLCVVLPSAVFAALRVKKCLNLDFPTPAVMWNRVLVLVFGMQILLQPTIVSETKLGQICPGYSFTHCVAGAECVDTPDYVFQCRLSVGQTCTNTSQCVPDTECHDTDGGGNKQCRILPGSPVNCAGDNDKCVTTAVCEVTTCKTNVGKTCISYINDFCRNGTECIDTGNSFRCLSSVGQPCTDNVQCACVPDAVCQDIGGGVKQCRIRVDSRRECGGDNTCVATAVCESGSCTEANKSMAAQGIGSFSAGTKQQWHSAAPWVSKQPSLGVALLTSKEEGARKCASYIACFILPCPAHRSRQQRQWQQQSVTGGRSRRSVGSALGRERRDTGSFQFTIGSDTSCPELSDDVYCNGPLEPGQQYLVVVFSCTKGGCSETTEPSEVTTKEKEDSQPIGGIVGGVVAVVAVIVIVVVVVVVIRRRRS
ncbi:uncharacterized protein LOC143298251 [Babylonia areolata]|uniref:uncharacterized protein LOC143298251 n=1 Tax=Babylonia areolata TaxID=304850 RepID=UPI003FD645AC